MSLIDSVIWAVGACFIGVVFVIAGLAWMGLVRFRLKNVYVDKYGVKHDVEEDNK